MDFVNQSDATKHQPSQAIMLIMVVPVASIVNSNIHVEWETVLKERIGFMYKYTVTQEIFVAGKLAWFPRQADQTVVVE